MLEPCLPIGFKIKLVGLENDSSVTPKSKDSPQTYPEYIGRDIVGDSRVKSKQVTRDSKADNIKSKGDTVNKEK